MNLIPALLLAIPVIAVVLAFQIILILQNRKPDSKKKQPSRTDT